MKRSLPVILCVAGVLLVALLIGNGFLSLPGSDEDQKLADASQEERSTAPLIDPESLEVEYGDPEDDQEDGEDKDRKKDKQADRKRKGKDKKDQSKKERKGDPKRKSEGTAAKPRVAPDVQDRNPRGKKDPANPKPRKNDREPKPGRTGPAPASVTVTDLTGDPEGEGTAPGYMDIETVTLRQTDELMIVELGFAKKIPAAMPNGDANMLTSVEVDRGNQKVSVYAEGSENGWQAHTNRSAEFPGSMEIDGQVIRFTLPRSFFGNEFAWYAHSSWTKSTTTKTDYFFDFAPDDQNGQFPSGGTT